MSVENLTTIYKEVSDLVNKFWPGTAINSFSSEIKPIPGKIDVNENMLLLALGGTGSGKTYVVNHILEGQTEKIIFKGSPTASFDQTLINKDKVDNRIILSPSAYDAMQNMIRYLILRLEIIRYTIYKNFIHTFPMMEQIKINAYMKRFTPPNGIDKAFFSMDNRVFLVLDDCGSEISMNKATTDLLTKIVMIRRHIAVNIIISAQSFTQIPKSIRRQITDVLLTKSLSSEDLYLIFPQLNACCLSLKELKMKAMDFSRAIDRFHQNGSLYSSLLFTNNIRHFSDGSSRKISIHDLKQ